MQDLGELPLLGLNCGQAVNRLGHRASHRVGFRTLPPDEWSVLVDSVIVIDIEIVERVQNRRDITKLD